MLIKAENCRCPKWRQRSLGEHDTPGLVALEATMPPEEVFAALQMQRSWLRHNQQVPEWVQALPDESMLLFCSLGSGFV